MSEGCGKPVAVHGLAELNCVQCGGLIRALTTAQLLPDGRVNMTARSPRRRKLVCYYRLRKAEAVRVAEAKRRREQTVWVTKHRQNIGPDWNVD